MFSLGMKFAYPSQPPSQGHKLPQLEKSWLSKISVIHCDTVLKKSKLKCLFQTIFVGNMCTYMCTFCATLVQNDTTIKLWNNNKRKFIFSSPKYSLQKPSTMFNFGFSFSSFSLSESSGVNFQNGNDERKKKKSFKSGRTVPDP